MSLRKLHIRFDPEVLEFISREAAHIGVSTSEYIRAAAHARAVFSYARRHPRGQALWEELYEVAQRVAEESDTLTPLDE